MRQSFPQKNFWLDRNFVPMAGFYVSRGVKNSKNKIKVMKTNTILIMAVACGLTGIAQAEEREREPKRDRGNRVDKPFPPEVIDKFDKDSDGKLSDDERAAAREAMMDHRKDREGNRDKWMLEKFDKDGDGKLSDEEKEAMEAARKAKHEEFKKEMLKKYDKDGDGELSDEEKEEMRKDMKDKHRKPGGPGRPGEGGDFRKKTEGGGDDEAPSVLGE